MALSAHEGRDPAPITRLSEFASTSPHEASGENAALTSNVMPLAFRKFRASRRGSGSGLTMAAFFVAGEGVIDPDQASNCSVGMTRE